jgi:hypothetical protein
MSASLSAAASWPPFQLDLPPGWTDRSVYVFTGPVEHGVRHTLTIEVDERGGKGGLDAFVASRLAAVRAGLSTAQVLKDGRTTASGGAESHELIVKQSTADGSPLLVRRLLQVDGAAGVVFTATYTKWSARTWGAQIDRMMESFRLGT